ncbi:cytosine permease [Streptomyces sp. NPDC057543]|uniref:cytosine permease n=1 Tax=Streptomyces sp. NPDC057543 TaxID=3346163 RepID=UPI0036B44893
MPLLTMGAGLIVLGGLNSWQVPTVAIAGPVVGFGPAGLVSIAGKEGGTPGVALFRAALDQRGNPLPGAPIRIARRGRETANAVTGTYAAAVAAVATWAAGPGVGLPLTGVEWLSGPFTDGWTGRHGLGWTATIAVSAAPYTLLPRPAERGRGSGPRSDAPLHI